MSLDYSEKRDFFRMNMNCGMEYTINGSGVRKSGLMKNLSGDGVLIEIDQQVEPGTEVRLSIKPEKSLTPPLDVTIEVLRCDKNDPEHYEIAGNITKR